MTEPISLAIQAAFVAALEADAELATHMGGTVRVFDPVPPKPQFPYIVIGDDEMVDNSNSCAGGTEVFARVFIFSRVPGYEEIKRIGGRVRQLLDAKLVLEDHYITTHEMLSGEYSPTKEQSETKGDLLFRFKTWENTP